MMGKERWPVFAAGPCRQGLNSWPGKELREGTPDKGKEGLISLLKGGHKHFLRLIFYARIY